MLRTVVALLAGILALNILVVAGLAILGVWDGNRRRREIVELEAIWQAPGYGGRHRSRPRSRRYAGVLFVTLLLGATSALASPDGRGVVTSVIDMVASRLGGEPAGRQASPIGDERSSPVQFGEGTGRRSSSGLTDAREGAVPIDSPATEHSPPGLSPSPPPVALTVPTSPSAVTAVAVSSGQVRVDWVDVPDESSYRVERSADGVGGWTTLVGVGQDITSAVDGGLGGGVTFYYRVFASNPAGDSTASSVASATTSVDPATPTTVTAVAISSSQVALDWADVGSETGYRVERRLSGDDNWLTIATTGADITEFVDAGLAAGTSYSYRVFAMNPGGDSLPSEVASVTTSSDPIIEP